MNAFKAKWKVGDTVQYRGLNAVVEHAELQKPFNGEEPFVYYRLAWPTAVWARESELSEPSATVDIDALVARVLVAESQLALLINHANGLTCGSLLHRQPSITEYFAKLKK